MKASFAPNQSGKKSSTEPPRQALPPTGGPVAVHAERAAGAEAAQQYAMSLSPHHRRASTRASISAPTASPTRRSRTSLTMLREERRRAAGGDRVVAKPCDGICRCGCDRRRHAALARALTAGDVADAVARAQVAVGFGLAPGRAMAHSAWGRLPA